MPFILTSRHLDLLEALNEVGCLDTQYIYHHFFGAVSLRRCQQILADLANEKLTYQAKLLATFVPSNRNAPQTKRVPSLSFLSPEGARILLRERNLMPFRVLRSRPQPYTLKHRYDHTKTRLALDRSLEEVGESTPEWILESDVRKDLPDKTPPNQRAVLYHSFGNDQNRYSCIPDAACVFTVSGNRFLIHWEHDRSTETKAQISRKAKGLNALLSQQTFDRYWPTLDDADKLRIFWTVISIERMRSICTALKVYPTVLERSRFLINPKGNDIGADGIDTRQLVTDRVFYLPDGTLTSLEVKT